MGPCCVDGCELITEDTIYFEFPTSRGLRKQWQKAVNIPAKIPLGSVVCNRHFCSEDYEHYRGKVRLKRKVVPTLMLDVKKPVEDVSSEKLPENGESSSASEPVPESTQDTEKSTEENVCTVVNNENVNKSSDPSALPDPKEDIEEMITNYQIKNKLPNTALLPEPEIVPVVEPTEDSMIVDVDNQPDPVFIEVSVDKDSTAACQDCLMLLESVQVDVDPSTLMLPEREEEDELEDLAEKDPNRKEDPISLLTSSDDDDVIIQEPHIDVVEVSSSTDEDNMPLVTLVQKKSKKKKKKTRKKFKNDIDMSKFGKLWGLYDFYCIQCSYSTTSSLEYNNHVAEHSTILQVCQVCNYTTASKAQFARHARKHKDEKKFKCHLCEYKARHKMSLMYHLQSHEGKTFKALTTESKGFKCKKCGFRSDNKLIVLKHVKLCSNAMKMYSCDSCDYETKRKSDLKRHKIRRHKEYDMDFDDVDYVPNEC